ncbi:MAG: hypothetical protein Fur002_11250 [Anaerolineales bacterium]
MTAQQIKETEPTEDQNAQLEKNLIAEYLREKGYSLEALKKLPAELAERLMKDASQYASLKLEEVESRARLVKELQEDSSPLEK